MKSRWVKSGNKHSNRGGKKIKAKKAVPPSNNPRARKM